MYKVLEKKSGNHLDYLMGRLQISSSRLSEISGVDHSLITKWRRGERKLTTRSKGLRPIAAALLSIDDENAAKIIAAPHKIEGDSDEAALAMYLVTEDSPALKPRTAPPKRQTSGEYTVTYHVYLGKKGLRSAVLSMLDYIMTLPPGQEVVNVVNSDFDWLTSDFAFMLMYIKKMKQVIARGTVFTTVVHNQTSSTDISMFAGTWVAEGMMGNINSMYCDIELPKNVMLACCIKGYWSLRLYNDAEVEDGMYTAMYTDPIDIKQDVKLCTEAKACAQSAIKRDFLSSVAAVSPKSAKGFMAIQRTPCFGFMRQNEFKSIAGKDKADVPKCLLQPDEGFPQVPIKLILCRDDLLEALCKERKLNVPISEVLGHRAYIPSNTLKRQLSRLLEAMQERSDCEVALVPKCAFDRIGVETLTLKDSASLAWLNEPVRSIYTEDEALTNSMCGFCDYVWDRLLAGWKRKSNVVRQLKKWLKGEELDAIYRETSAMRNWDVVPRD